LREVEEAFWATGAKAAAEPARRAAMASFILTYFNKVFQRSFEANCCVQ